MDRDMNRLIKDTLEALPVGTKVSTILMVIDYILCTTQVNPGEEVEVLSTLLDISDLLHKDWHPVFDSKVLALAVEGQALGKSGEVVKKDIAIIHKALCAKRASIYNDKEPSICAMADTVRTVLVS